MKVFIDSTIPSLFLKNELTDIDEEHLEAILLSFQTNRCKIITLKTIKEKINRIPELNTSQNNKVLLLLKDIDEVEENGYCDGLKAGKIGGYEAFHPIYEQLINLVDNLEARQIYQAISYKCDFYLTVNRQLLKKVNEINNLGIKIIYPEILSEIIIKESVFKPLV